jgi:hypothetical protein
MWLLKRVLNLGVIYLIVTGTNAEIKEILADLVTTLGVMQSRIFLIFFAREKAMLDVQQNDRFTCKVKPTGRTTNARSDWDLRLKRAFSCLRRSFDIRSISINIFGFP